MKSPDSPQAPRKKQSPMLKTLLVSVFLVGLSTDSASASFGVKRGQIKNLVTFGDSYSDVGSPADGGLAWPSYAVQDGGFNLYPFAKSGATCSNNITYRPFPSLYESQLPAYFAERANGTLRLNEDETAYTLWIGTNDVGTNGLLTGHGAPGVSVVDTTACAVSWVQTMYNAGARNFLFQSVCSMTFAQAYIRLLTFDSTPDDTTGADCTIQRKHLLQPLLDIRTQFNSLEHSHGRDNQGRKRYILPYAQATCSHFAWCTHRYTRLHLLLNHVTGD
jgi:phospholipase/lecithinase/hemolysin